MTAPTYAQTRRLRVEIYLGTNWDRQVVVYDGSTEEPLDITNDTITVTLRSRTDGSAVFKTDNVTGDVDIVNGKGGVCEPKFVAATLTAQSVTAGTYNVYLIVDHDGSPKVVAAGTATVVADVIS